MATKITSKELSDWIRSEKRLLIVDCRSFLVYNKSHIAKATNLKSNSIMRRRSRGAMTLENTITNVETRSNFLSGEIDRAVVYDQLGDLDVTSEYCDTKKNAVMAINILKGNSQNCSEIVYLEGGYQTFEAEYPNLCENSVRKSQQDLLSPPEEKVKTPSTTSYYDQGSPVEILSHLFLGSAHHASQKEQLKSLGITALVNASRSCENHFEEDFTYKRIPVEDNGSADISTWFDETIAFINNEKEKGGKTFIHCHAGISRSATLCLAYLMTRYQVSLNDAYKYVKNRRSVISPNFNFMGQLLKLESTVNEKSSSFRNSGASLFDTSTVARMEAISELESQDDVFEQSSPVEETKPLTSVTASKLYKRRAGVMPLKLSVIPKTYADKTRCQTAPVISTGSFVFGDVKRSCNREIGFAQSLCRHRRTLTLSS